MHVLVVDDDLMVRRLMADCLHEAGYHVREAGNAADAMASIEHDDSLELVVTDVRMPGEMDGFALSHWLKQRLPATKVLVVSGYAGRDPAHGPVWDAFLAKPFTARALELAVCSVMGS